MTTGYNEKGTECSNSGVYYCSQHPSYTIIMHQGDTFPPCNYPKDPHGSIWVLKR